MSTPRHLVGTSHLSEQRQAGKMYANKKDCTYCYHKYDSELSDALKTDDYCSIECEVEDQYEATDYYTHKKEKPL